MSNFLSNRQRELKIGIVSYTENNTVLEVTGNTNITGIATASSFSGSGINLTGIVTSIVAGSNITISGSTGQVTINSSGSSSTKNVNTYTATEGQTTFSATYSVGYVDVYLNGVKLSQSQYTAINGTSIVLVDGASLDDVVEIVGFVTNAASLNATYATNAGIATYADTAGIATNATYATNAGIATYASTAGIATVAQGLTGTPNIVVGVATATSFVKSGGTSSQFLKADGSVDSATYATQSYVGLSTVGLLASSGNGSNLTGIVTSIVAGTNVTISGSTGQVTINASGGGGGTATLDILEVMMFS